MAARRRLETHAHDAGRVVGIRCGKCNLTRLYKPLELREMIGNVTIDKVREKVRCQQCGSREWMDAQLLHPNGEQAHTIRFRRLVQIRGRGGSYGAMGNAAQ